MQIDSPVVHQGQLLLSHICDMHVLVIIHLRIVNASHAGFHTSKPFNSHCMPAFWAAALCRRTGSGCMRSLLLWGSAECEGPDKRAGICKGVGFINYGDPDAAARAVAAMNGMPMGMEGVCMWRCRPTVPGRANGGTVLLHCLLSVAVGCTTACIWAGSQLQQLAVTAPIWCASFEHLLEGGCSMALQTCEYNGLCLFARHACVLCACGVKAK